MYIISIDKDISPYIYSFGFNKMERYKIFFILDVF